MDALVKNSLGQLTTNQLVAICQKSPHALMNIAAAAGKGYPAALSVLANQSCLGKLNATQFLAICEKSHHTLDQIVIAAIKGHPTALNALTNKIVLIN